MLPARGGAKTGRQLRSSNHTRHDAKRSWLAIGAAGTAITALAAVLLVGWAASQQSGAIAPPPPLVSTPQPDQRPAVFTYFFYWYDLPDGAHSAELTHRPVSEPRVSYENVAWFEKELRDISAAGIDVALADYWGPAEPGSLVGLRNLSAAGATLRAAGEDVPDVAMFFDTGLTGLIGRWPESHRVLRRTENQERVYEQIHDFYSTLPGDQWAMLDGRPVVWLWAAYFGITFDQSFFDFLYARFEQDFGARPYVVAEVSWAYELHPGSFGSGAQPDPDAPARVDDFYYWGAALFGYRPPGNIAAAGPGYDERQLAGGDRTGGTPTVTVVPSTSAISRPRLPAPLASRHRDLERVPRSNRRRRVAGVRTPVHRHHPPLRRPLPRARPD